MPGWGVGVEDAVVEDLLEVGAEGFVGEGCDIGFHENEGREGGDILALDFIHGEHLIPAIAGDGGGDDDIGEGPQVALK